MSDSSVSKKKLAYDKIKNMIIENEVAKDAPLVERTLCDQLGISRTPVREALRELANEGLVEVIDGKGVFVKKIDFRDMLEIFEVRDALECKAIELFIERADKEQLDTFRAVMKEQEEAYKNEKYKEFMDADMKIHYLIADGAKNTRLKNGIMAIYDQIRQLAISTRDDPVVREHALRDHKAILQAVEEGNIEAAVRAVSEHIHYTMEIHKEKYYLL